MARRAERPKDQFIQTGQRGQPGWSVRNGQNDQIRQNCQNIPFNLARNAEMDREDRLAKMVKLSEKAIRSRICQNDHSIKMAKKA